MSVRYLPPPPGRVPGAIAWQELHPTGEAPTIALTIHEGSMDVVFCGEGFNAKELADLYDDGWQPISQTGRVRCIWRRRT